MEPLKGKQHDIEENTDGYYHEDIKSAVEGLIKFHEDRIEKILHQLETTWEKDVNLYSTIDDELEKVEREYESIMAIEYWFEDVM